MRPMHLEFEDDLNCAYLDRQFMLGDSILVAPVFTPSPDGKAVNQKFYLPKGKWTHLISGKVIEGGDWHEDSYDYFSLPLFVRQNSVIPFGTNENRPDYDFEKEFEWHIFGIDKGQRELKGLILNADESKAAGISVKIENKGKNTRLKFSASGLNKVIIKAEKFRDCKNCKVQEIENDLLIIPDEKEFEVLI